VYDAFCGIFVYVDVRRCLRCWEEGVCSADGRLKLFASANTQSQLAEQQQGKRVPVSRRHHPRRRRLYNTLGPQRPKDVPLEHRPLSMQPQLGHTRRTGDDIQHALISHLMMHAEMDSSVAASAVLRDATAGCMHVFNANFPYRARRCTHPAHTPCLIRIALRSCKAVAQVASPNIALIAPLITYHIAGLSRYCT
jgi:hypothetical protein